MHMTAKEVAELLTQREALLTPEIGVRMALGAQRTSVVAMVIGQALAVTAVGIAIGAGSRWQAVGSWAVSSSG